MTEPISQTITSQLMFRLRDRILAGDYAPGSALRQDTLAAEFGTSKIPVREALVQLQSEGLVDIFPQRGFQVRPLSTSELDEVFRLRLQIEPSAVARGAHYATADDRVAARDALNQLNEALVSGEFAASGHLNRSFHLTLIVPRLHPVAAEVIGRLHTLAQRYVQAHLRPDGRIKRATREHTALYEAWSGGNGKEAAMRTQTHIAATQRDLARAATSQARRPEKDIGRTKNRSMQRTSSQPGQERQAERTRGRGVPERG